MRVVTLEEENDYRFELATIRVKSASATSGSEMVDHEIVVFNRQSTNKRDGNYYLSKLDLFTVMNDVVVHLGGEE